MHRTDRNLLQRASQCPRRARQHIGSPLNTARPPGAPHGRERDAANVLVDGTVRVASFLVDGVRARGCSQQWEWAGSGHPRNPSGLAMTPRQPHLRSSVCHLDDENRARRVSDALGRAMFPPAPLLVALPRLLTDPTVHGVTDGGRTLPRPDPATVVTAPVRALSGRRSRRNGHHEPRRGARPHAHSDLAAPPQPNLSTAVAPSSP